MKKICLIQPILTHYRMPVYRELAGHCRVDLLFSPVSDTLGFGDVSTHEAATLRFLELPTFRPFGDRVGMFQWGISRHILHDRPDAILTFANPRFLSFWTTLVLARALQIPVYAHGHGPYQKNRITLLYRILIKFILRLVTGYICYAPVVYRSFIEHGFSSSKLSIAPNTLVNDLPVRPNEKSGRERGVLFLGRLRSDTRLDALVRTLERLRADDGINLTLHVAGGGEYEKEFRRRWMQQSWIAFYGEVYDLTKIRRVSQECFVSCYPGVAGLSVIHMFSLSLPVVTHDDLRSHGPEPSMIRDSNGAVFYDHNSPDDQLYLALRSLALDPQRVAAMQNSAFEDYQRLTTPHLSERLWTILQGTETSERDGLVRAVHAKSPRTVREASEGD